MRREKQMYTDRYKGYSAGSISAPRRSHLHPRQEGPQSRLAGAGIGRRVVDSLLTIPGVKTEATRMPILHGIGRGYKVAEILGEKYAEGGVLVWKGIRGGPREITYQNEETFALTVALQIERPWEPC